MWFPAPHPFPITNLISFYCPCLFNCLASPPKCKLQGGQRMCIFSFSFILKAYTLHIPRGLNHHCWLNKHTSLNNRLFLCCSSKKATNSNRNPLGMNTFTLADFQQERKFHPRDTLLLKVFWPMAMRFSVLMGPRFSKQAALLLS